MLHGPEVASEKKLEGGGKGIFSLTQYLAFRVG
jgi:hypothetical protein